MSKPPEESRSDYEKELAERNRMAVELDVETARKIYPTMSIESMLPMLHKLRYEITNIDPALRHESRAWLEQHGLKRYQGLPWPPAGELEI